MSQMESEPTKECPWESTLNLDSESDIRRWTEEELNIFGFSPSQKIAHKYQEKEAKLPSEYTQWESVLKKKAAEQIPE